MRTLIKTQHILWSKHPLCAVALPRTLLDSFSASRQLVKRGAVRVRHTQCVVEVKNKVQTPKNAAHAPYARCHATSDRA